MNTDKFDCNICFDEVKEPVVTRCGHLFCWNCILTWMNRSNQQCPVCQAIISKDNVIPLYGRGQDNTDPRNKTSEPRPKPKRPTTTPHTNQTSMFGGYDGRISISFGAFPFSIILPMGFGSGSFGLFNIFRGHDDTSNMTDGILYSFLSQIHRLTEVYSMLYKRETDSYPPVPYGTTYGSEGRLKNLAAGGK